MAFDMRGWGVSLDAACEDKISEGVQLCPFLRNIGVTTSFASKLKFPIPSPTRAGRGPIFEDGPGFENSFRLFHGKDGVVPLARASGEKTSQPQPQPQPLASEASNLSFHPLSARAASISLSPFGPAGPFGFDAFMGKHNAQNSNKKQKKKEPHPEKDHKSNVEAHIHEAMSSDWLATGQCPIAKSFRAVSGVLPLVSKMLKLPKGMKYRCPPAIVAARAALARTTAVKALRPQALPTKVLAIGMLGMALNVPLGVWREHTKKFSPQWFLAVHATIPFIAMLRKAVVMPKYAIAFTIGSAVLGQAVGARAEKIRLANLKSSIEIEQSQSCTEALPVAINPQILDPATGNTTDTSHKVFPLVENLAAVQDVHPQLPTKLLAVSTTSHVSDSVPSVLERKSPATVHQRQDMPFVEEGLSLELPQMGVPRRLTVLPQPSQCGSEALVNCSMSSSSQPVLVS